MPISKLILNNEVQMDVTSDTVEASKLLSGETATKNDGTKITGTFAMQSKSVVPTESSQMIFPDTGFGGLSQVSVGAISSNYVGTGVSRMGGSTITPTEAFQVAVPANTFVSGAINVGSIPSDYARPSGTLSITANGMYNVTSYSGANVSISVEGITIDDIAERTISGNIIGGASSISAYAFYYCSLVTSVSFPNAVIAGNYAFYNCMKLSDIYFPELTNISAYAFAYCRSLKSAYLSKVSIISNYGFASCEQLTAVDFPNALSIANSAFYNCSRLTTISFPNLSYIGNNAFCSCYSLTTVNFPNVTYIGGSAFSNCSRLTTADFPNVSDIRSYAFFSCRSLTTISLPNALSIGGYTFLNCSALRSVYLLGSVVVSMNFGTPPFPVVNPDFTVYVPSSLFADYVAAYSTLASYLVSV